MKTMVQYALQYILLSVVFFKNATPLWIVQNLSLIAMGPRQPNDIKPKLRYFLEVIGGSAEIRVKLGHNFKVQDL